MRRAFDSVRIDGTVVIGEGERDEAPMLYIGERVGKKGPESPKVDIALDPLEGTTICSRGGENAISVIAVAEEGNFLHAPDTYMDKIACGAGAKGKIDIEAPIKHNIEVVAKALGKTVDEVTVIILDRPRHEKLIGDARKTGARIRLITDGDVSAAIATCRKFTGVDLLVGIGGAPEGVISAAALRCVGGDFQGKLKFRNEEERTRAQKMGVKDLDRVYAIDELARGNVMFCATGVTDGSLLKGVTYLERRVVSTHSLVMRSQTGTIREIHAEHHLDSKPV